MNSPSPGPLRVGLIGCGAISNAYFEGLKPYEKFAAIVACADLDLDRAKKKALEHGVKKVSGVQDLLTDPDIDLILNLTIPAAHASVDLQALQAGKHVYCEKPFSLTYSDGLRVMDSARELNLRVGCAPDTVLGGGIQTCRRLIDEGAIGRPISATANVIGRGHESWHPSPEFYYKAGGGPLFDIGPYFLTSLVTMLGPVKSVSALAKTTFAERLITSQPLHGTRIKVEVPTHLLGLLEFGDDVFADVTMTFDVWTHHQPLLEIYGTEGSLQCPDPNGHGGEVRLWTEKNPEWIAVPLSHDDQVKRGVGVAEMAAALRANRPHRMGGDLGLHVVEVMEAFHRSAQAGSKVLMESTCSRPAPMPPGLPLGQLD